MSDREETVRRFIAEGKLEQALAECREAYEHCTFDADSCQRAGDFGESTRAERKGERWAERMREIERLLEQRNAPSDGAAYVMVDIESDGPIPGDYSMVCFGAVIVEPGLGRTFYGKLRPISGKWIPEALAVSGFSRDETVAFDEPEGVMARFDAWIRGNIKGQPMFVSDNNGFDWQFINWYFHHFLGRNPFGHSSTNLGSLYKGLVKDTFRNFKHLRRTEHTHNPLDDAIGNAEALLHMKETMGLRIRL